MHLQEYCRQMFHKDAVPVKSCQELQASYDWFVTRVEKMTQVLRLLAEAGSMLPAWSTFMAMSRLKSGVKAAFQI